MKFENTEVMNFKGAFRGMRNPLESWARSDSDFSNPLSPKLGEADLNLAKKLINSGSEHRKFLRQIFICVDITAPLYWFKEFDTYHVGTTANSTSTMHKIASKPITLSCFEIDDFNEMEIEGGEVKSIISYLENLREKYNETKDKDVWKELVRWLPESWLQTRTVTMNYENVLSIVKQRKNHKLNEWSGKDNDCNENFIKWAKTLPYAEDLIFID